MKFAFIDVEKALWPVAVQCDVFGVSSSGYYAWKRRPEALRAAEDAELVIEIKAAHKTGRGAYGSPAYTASCARTGAASAGSASNG